MPRYLFEDTFVVTYEVEADDLDAAREAARSVDTNPSEGEWLETEYVGIRDNAPERVTDA